MDPPLFVTVLWFRIVVFICSHHNHRQVSRLRFANRMKRMRFTLKANVFLALVSQSWMTSFCFYIEPSGYWDCFSPVRNTACGHSHFKKEKKFNSWQLCRKVTCNDNLQRNMVESKVQHLSLKCSGVKENKTNTALQILQMQRQHLWFNPLYNSIIVHENLHGLESSCKAAIISSHPCV